jgi:hypothetical protein
MAMLGVSAVEFSTTDCELVRRLLAVEVMVEPMVEPLLSDGAAVAVDVEVVVGRHHQAPSCCSQLLLLKQLQLASARSSG